MITSSISVTRQFAIDLVEKASNRLKARIAAVPVFTDEEAREILKEIRKSDQKSESFKEAKAKFDLFSNAERYKQGLETIEFMAQFFAADPSATKVTLTATDYLLLSRFGDEKHDSTFKSLNVFEKAEGQLPPIKQK